MVKTHTKATANSISLLSLEEVANGLANRFREGYSSDIFLGDQVDTVCFNISKAFDNVNYELLLHKLSTHGVSPALTGWFQSYPIVKAVCKV